jgi:hypothetical protein
MKRNDNAKFLMTLHNFAPVPKNSATEQNTDKLKHLPEQRFKLVNIIIQIGRAQ